MQLQQVNGFGVQVGKTALDKGGEVLAVIAFGHVRREAATGFCSDVELLAPLFAKLRQEQLAAAIAVNVRSVEEIYAQAQRTVESSQRFFIINCSPHAANGPCAKADARNFPASSSEFAVFHDDHLKI